MTHPPLPDEPACWDWPLPPLPQPCQIGHVRDWQDHRCAVCGVRASDRSPLLEDHDHSTGDTRGFLCHRCNVCEGRANPRPVFLLYRKRYPTLILGVLHRKGCFTHPDVVAADREWANALSALASLTPENERYRQRMIEELRAEFGEINLPKFLYTPSPERTQLMAAAERVGFTAEEWAATTQMRLATAEAAVVHLPSGDVPAKQACNSRWEWRPPPHQGRMRRLCVDCHEIDPVRALHLVGDGYGYPVPGSEVCVTCAGSPPIGFTCNSCGAIAG